MAEQTSGGGVVGKVLGGVLGAASQGNLILAGAIQGIQLYRAMRDAWRAAHPKEPSTPDGWKEDSELIDLLSQDSGKLVQHANDLLAKYAAAQPPAEG